MAEAPEPLSTPLAGAPDPTCPSMAGAPEPPNAPMPSSDPRWRSLAEEATCPICLGYFTEPVSVHCGHTFCTPCITRYWQGVQGGPYPCPQCRETAPTNTLRPNWQAASMVHILAQGAPVAPPRDGHLMCTKHDEKLKLFCQEDQTPICVVCDRSREHRGHTVTPIMEAAQDYRDKFQSYLDNMRRKLENICELRLDEETSLTDMEEMFKNQREQITSVFNKMQQFLEKEKCHHLSNLEEKEKRTLQEIGEKVTKLDEQHASVKDQIIELESKSQQTDVELLTDVKNILSRYEDLISLNPPSGLFEEEENQTTETEEEGEEDLEKKIIESLDLSWAHRFAVAVTLDPDTAHRRLILSEDGRSVRPGDRAQDLPDTPERYNYACNILGRERLSAGRHYWEVEVGDKTLWKLGVCDESASRKGEITYSPDKGYWTVGLGGGQYKAHTSPITTLTPHVAPRVVGLFLDHEGHRLSVFNVSDRSLLFSFSGAPFPRTLRPFFCPCNRNGGKSVRVLRVLAVPGGGCDLQRLSPSVH